MLGKCRISINSWDAFSIRIESPIIVADVIGMLTRPLTSLDLQGFLLHQFAGDHGSSVLCFPYG